MRRLVIAIAVLAFCSVGCGDDDGAAVDAGSSTDRFGLSSIDMPADETGIRQAFEAMPEEISGTPRMAADEFELILSYGDSNTLVAFPFPGGGPETLAEDLSQFESEAGAVVEASQLDASSGLVWLMGSFTDQGGAGVVYVMVWGTPGDEWAFNASAESPEMRDAMVRSFVDAAGGSD